MCVVSGADVICLVRLLFEQEEVRLHVASLRSDSQIYICTPTKSNISSFQSAVSPASHHSKVPPTESASEPQPWLTLLLSVWGLNQKFVIAQLQKGEMNQQNGSFIRILLVTCTSVFRCCPPLHWVQETVLWVAFPLAPDRDRKSVIYS